MINLFIYAITVYGLTNIVVLSNGPFYLCKNIREFAHKIHRGFGELFSCMMCFSTWVGLVISLVDYYLLKTTSITPFNTIMPNESVYYIVLMDMFFSSGITWLIHQVEELIERTNIVYYEEEVK